MLNNSLIAHISTFCDPHTKLNLKLANKNLNQMINLDEDFNKWKMNKFQEKLQIKCDDLRITGNNFSFASGTVKYQLNNVNLDKLINYDKLTDLFFSSFLVDEIAYPGFSSGSLIISYPAKDNTLTEIYTFNGAKAEYSCNFF